MSRQHHLRTETPNWSTAFAVFTYLSHGLVRVFGVPVEEVRVSQIELAHGSIWPDPFREHMISVETSRGRELRRADDFDNHLDCFDKSDSLALVDTFWPAALRAIKHELNQRLWRFKAGLACLFPSVDDRLPTEAIVKPVTDGWEV